MKWIKLIYSFAIIASLTACGSQSSSDNQEPSGSNQVGSVQLSFLHQTSRTMSPSNPNIDRINVYGTGPDEAFEVNTTENQQTFYELAFGEWVFRVTAYNADNIVIAEGVIGITIEQEVNEATVLLEEREGNGTFSLTVKWPEDTLISPSLSAKLTPLDEGEPISIDFLFGDSGIYEVGKSMQAMNGLYTLDLELLENGVVIRTWKEAVQILQNQTTSGTIYFEDIPKTDPVVDSESTIKFQVNVNKSVNINLGEDFMLHMSGAPILIEADTSELEENAENLEYQWYVNGERYTPNEDTKLDFEFHNEGIYDVDLIVIADHQGTRTIGSSHVTIKSMGIPFKSSDVKINTVSSADYYGTLTDFNNDGFPDYVGSSINEGLVLYINDKSGNLVKNKVLISQSDFPTTLGKIISEDFDDNGFKDIVVGHGFGFSSTPNNSSLIFYNSAEGFSDPIPLYYSEDETMKEDSTSDVLVFDENGDNKLDLVIVAAEGIYIYRNKPLETTYRFASSPDLKLDFWNLHAKTAVAYDFDSNGTEEILLSGIVFDAPMPLPTKTLLFSKNSDDGSYTSNELTDFNGFISDVQVANIFNPDEPVLLMLNDFYDTGSNGLSLYNITAEGKFVFMDHYTNLDASSFTLADISMDSKPDVIFADSSDGSVDALITDETYFKRTGIPLSPSIGRVIATQVLAGDIDGDNDIDIISCAVPRQIVEGDEVHTTKLHLNLTSEFIPQSL